MAQETNPYLEPIENLRQIFSQLLDEPQVFPNANIVDWNRNVDLYWKWENQEPIDPDPPTPPDPEGDDDLPVDIVVSRNAVVKIVRNIKKEYIERDRLKKIEESSEPITDEEWEIWKEEEEAKYACLTEVENGVLSLDAAVLKEEWTPCTEDLPPLSYMSYLTSDSNKIIGIHAIDGNGEWIGTEVPIQAWITLPVPYEAES